MYYHTSLHDDFNFIFGSMESDHSFARRVVIDLGRSCSVQDLHVQIFLGILRVAKARDIDLRTGVFGD